jgi:hypothetical protein
VGETHGRRTNGGFGPDPSGAGCPAPRRSEDRPLESDRFLLANQKDGAPPLKIETAWAACHPAKMIAHVNLMTYY